MTEIKPGIVGLASIVAESGGMWADGCAVRTCGPHTGHFIKAVAYCESSEWATLLARTPDPSLLNGLREARVDLDSIRVAGLDGYLTPDLCAHIVTEAIAKLDTLLSQEGGK